MARSKPAKPAKGEKEETKEARYLRLVAEAQANPNKFFPFKDCGIILGFGTNAMTALNGAGAPAAFRQMNPGMVTRWIEHNQALVVKIRNGESGDDEKPVKS